MRKHWKLHKMTADMSRAFDTIRRPELIERLKNTACTEDDIRLLKMLLTNTSLIVKIKKTESEYFAVTIGSFQGDGLSGKVFTLYLAGALNHLGP